MRCLPMTRWDRSRDPGDQSGQLGTDERWIEREHDIFGRDLRNGGEEEDWKRNADVQWVQYLQRTDPN